MRRGMWVGLVVVLLGLVFPSGTVAAPKEQSGGVHFGPFTLEAGQVAVGDQVVIGGPALLGEGAVVDGDLAVFGSLVMEDDAQVRGQLVVTGSADVAGTVQGDLFCAGSLVLRSTSVVDGDVTTAGTLEQEDGAVIRGELLEASGEPEWSVHVPLGALEEFSVTVPKTVVRPWMHWLSRGLQGVAFVLTMGLLSLAIVSLWPAQVESVGQVLMQAPLTVFGAGLLALILVSLGGALLFLTICLSPVALLLWVAVGAALLLGWVGFSTMLGRKFLEQGLRSHDVSPVLSAGTGSLILGCVVILSQVWGPVHALLLAVLIPALAGSVTLTRFGTQPYPAGPGAQ